MFKFRQVQLFDVQWNRKIIVRPSSDNVTLVYGERMDGRIQATRRIRVVFCVDNIYGQRGFKAELPKGFKGFIYFFVAFVQQFVPDFLESF